MICHACLQEKPVAKQYILPVQWYSSSGIWYYMCARCIGELNSYYPVWVLTTHECEQLFHWFIEKKRGQRVKAKQKKSQ